MRLVLAILFALLGGAGLALFFSADNGYVLLRHGDTLLETSLVFFSFLVLVAVILSLLAWRLLVMVWRMPERLGHAVENRRGLMAGRSFRRGLVRLFEGRWASAEIELTRRTWNPQTQLVNYLAAARAAHMQGAFERRDHYLAQADACKPGSTEAVLLTQAELLLSQRQHTRALPVLERLREMAPDNPYVLERLLQTLEQLADWSRLRSLLPVGESLGLGGSERFQLLSLRVYGEALKLAQKEPEPAKAVNTVWQGLPRKWRQHPGIVAVHAELLADQPEGHEPALKSIQTALKQAWNPELALLYGRLEARKPITQLAAVEEWLKQHGEPPELLLLAGQLCLRHQLWGRARSYFEQALTRTADVGLRSQLWQALAQVAEQTNDTAAALKAYRAALLIG